MRSGIVASLLASFIVFSANAQTHKEARQLLNEATEKLKSYDNLYIAFDYNFENTRVSPPVTQEESGSIALKGDDYHLEFMGMKQIRNGSKLYTILPEDEEVQITEYDEEENTGLTPTSILKSYQKGYSYKLGGTDTKDGKTIQYVILKPNASEEVDKIMVAIEKNTKKLTSLKQWGTNGTITTFNITSFEPNKNLPPNHFSFNKKDYPGYYIAD